jgi:hypothetical protein
MRLPRFRFTIRAFMVVVAATTTLVVVGIQARNWMQMCEFCLDVAEIHAGREQEEGQKLADVATLRSKGLATHTLVPIAEELYRKRLDFHVRMRLKWEQAARRPWQTVEDDPDEPTDERIVKKVDLGPLPYLKDNIPKLAVDASTNP